MLQSTPQWPGLWRFQCFFCRKLHEVKERLNQLRSLVQYYQTSTGAGEIPPVDERTAFQNMIEGYGQGIPAQNIL